MIAPFHISIHDTLDPFLNAYRVSLEIGSHSSCVLSAISFLMFSFVSGKPLYGLYENFNNLTETIPAIKTKTVLSGYQAIHNLLDERIENPGLLTGKYFDRACCFDKNEKEYDKSRVSLISCIISYIFNEYSMALECINICRQLQTYIRGQYLYPTFLFYESLVLLASSRPEDAKKR